MVCFARSAELDHPLLPSSVSHKELFTAAIKIQLNFASLVQFARDRVAEKGESCENRIEYFAPALEAQMEASLDFLCALSPAEQSDVLSDLIFDALGGPGPGDPPCMTRLHNCYMEEILGLFGEDQPVNERLRGLAEARVMECLRSDRPGSLVDLYGLARLVNQSFFETETVQEEIKDRIQRELRHDFWPLNALLALPGFSSAKNFLIENRIMVKTAIRRQVLDQRQDVQPVDLTESVELAQCEELLRDRKLLAAVGKRISANLRQNDLEGANHGLSLLPRDNEYLFLFAPEGEAVLERLRPRVERFVREMLSDAGEMKNRDLLVLRHTIKNFFSPEMRCEQWLADAIAAVEERLLEKKRVWPHLMDLLPVETNEDLQGLLGESAYQLYGEGKRRLNPSLRVLRRAMSNGEVIPESREMRELRKRHARLLRFADIFGLPDEDLEPFPEGAAEEPVAEYIERFTGRPWPLYQSSVSKISWKAILQKCGECLREDREKAARLAEQLLEAVPGTAGLYNSPELVGDAMQFQALSNANDNERLAGLQKTLRFRLATHDLLDPRIANTLQALCPGADSRNDSILIAEVINLLEQGKTTGDQRPRGIKAMTDMLHDKESTQVLGISRRWLAVHMGWL